MQSLWEFDQQAFRAIHLGLHRDWLDPVFWLISSTGLGWVQFATVILLPLLFSRRLPEIEHRPLKTIFRAAVMRWRDPVFLIGPMLFVMAFSGLISTGILKRMVDRERPSNLLDAVPQEGFYGRSFPSGHTTTSFAIAFMLLFVTWKTPNWKIGAFAMLWASLVGFSRIYRGVHWPTDVLGGICVGLIAACTAYLFMRTIAVQADVVEEAGAVDEASRTT